MADSAAMRISELAQHTGVSVRSIRFYHQLGILQRPSRSGRTGWYDEGHVARLGLIRRLQTRGYSLAAIADIVASQVPSVIAAEPVGGDHSVNEAAGGGPLVLDHDEVRAQVPIVAAEPHLLTEMVELGLLEPVSERSFCVPQPPLWRAGVALVGRGVPVRTVLQELVRLRADLGAIAERLAKIIERDVSPIVPTAADSSEDPTAELLQELWPAVLVAVGSVLSEATEQAVRVRLTLDAD